VVLFVLQGQRLTGVSDKPGSRMRLIIHDQYIASGMPWGRSDIGVGWRNAIESCKARRTLDVVLAS